MKTKDKNKKVLSVEVLAEIIEERARESRKKLYDAISTTMNNEVKQSRKSLHYLTEKDVINVLSKMICNMTHYQ